MFDKPLLVVRIVGCAIALLYEELWRRVRFAIIRRQVLWSRDVVPRDRNIVIIGASYAGYHAARLIARGLPAGSPYQVVVIEPNSHFQFTWVLPRFCVVPGHDHKAFVPYGGYVSGSPDGALRWVKDWVVALEADPDRGQGTVQLKNAEERISYDFLVVATGSGIQEGLPSRVNKEDKKDGIVHLQEMQRGIEEAKAVVVVGGGAAGVEVATDAKSLYPEKQIVLVHSRSALMHRFGPKLQASALEGALKLGVEVLLEERVVAEDAAARTVTLRSGKVLECDKYINCVGQKPQSEIIRRIWPDAVTPSGHIKVKSTLQIDHKDSGNTYACGDVADTQEANPNARSAMRQATIVADNIVQAAGGRSSRRIYQPIWADGFIKLTLGLDRSVNHVSDGHTELLLEAKEKDPALMSARFWAHMGEKAFKDPYMDSLEANLAESAVKM